MSDPNANSGDRAARSLSIVDVAAERAVVRRQHRFQGKVLGLRTDEVDLGDGQIVTRDVVEHPGAVGIVALDSSERMLFVRQYRHPVASLLWEPPAGLLDVAGEDPLAAAQRELYEEAGYCAEQWHVLVDFYTTPGGSDEGLRLYLARGLSEVEASDRHTGEAEERDMPVAWVPLDEAVTAVMAGRLHNPSAAVGVLAARTARDQQWSTVRPADAPWQRRSSASP